MKMVFQKNNQGTEILLDGKVIAVLPACNDAEDSFEQLDEQAFRWTRKCAPVTAMTMEVRANYKANYFQVPAVNYNGNGWGRGAQYFGYECDGTPWSYAWHRVAIPACTYTEDGNYAIALFGEEEGGMSGSVFVDGNETVQQLIWPETEAPKVLFKRSWEDPYYGTMEPQGLFSAIVMVMKVTEPKKKVHDLLDFAWKYFYREVKMTYTPEKVSALDALAFRQLWLRHYDGVTGFASGFVWSDEEGMFVKNGGRFEIGWVGQNACQACELLKEYIANGNEDCRDKALSVLDSWCEYAFRPNGLMLVHLVAKPNHLDSIVNGDIPVSLDSCNLGTAATYLFKAAKLCKEAGIDRPLYLQRAMGLVDAFVRYQQESGEFAKSYFLDGSIDSPHGSVGSFMALPVLDAWELTGDEKYRDSGFRAMDYYLNEFEKSGVTTAGALDSFCIDKESAAPLLRGVMRMYELTKEKKYLDIAEDIAYYLATWQWHYSVRFPADSEIVKTGYDSWGSTSVSAAHNALDHYGLYWVPEYVRLAELTGNPIWRERARALWYNGTQLLSDGTTIIHDRVRPAGAQDESVRHTRWARPDYRCFVSSEWCTVWQGTFRRVALEMMDNWDILR